MSPRDLDTQIVVRRLVLMDDLLATLEQIDATTGDPIARLALERILTQLVDLAGDINGHVAGVVLGMAPGTTRESFTLAARAGVITAQVAEALAPSVGMRNVLVHEYVDVDRQRVIRAAPMALEAYRGYVNAVRDWLSGDENET